MVCSENPKEYLEREVNERASHKSKEDVRTTCSFARAERLIGREYHGRFLIELLQNAADAWRSDDRSNNNNRSKVAVIITDEPALVVANQGVPMSAKVIIESLGHIGASTKSEGEAIGHKGIGFKSVLEITLTPEIYTGLQSNTDRVDVRFDPRLAYTKIKEASPEWSSLISGVQGINVQEIYSPVPVLRFPIWNNNVPAIVSELITEKYDTIVRLPFDEYYSDRLNLDKEKWLSNVRDSLRDVSDQILLLLGCFSEVVIDDRIANKSEVVIPKWRKFYSQHNSESTKEVIKVFRNKKLSSSWLLFRKALPNRVNLAGEIAIGIRCDGGPARGNIRSAAEEGASAPFHLFFPTRISSGLPFLLHGYFEVDAARTGFYRGSANRNAAILRELALLTATAVQDIAEGGKSDLVDAVNLIAEASDPDDDLARSFRVDVLKLLDDVKWIPTKNDSSELQFCLPKELLLCKPCLTRQIARVFPPQYIKAHLCLSLPDMRLTDEAITFVQARQPEDNLDQWEILDKLCRPGTRQIWAENYADQGFLDLLDLVTIIDAENRASTYSLLNGLKGKPDSCLIPAIHAESGRKLLPVPDPSEGIPGNRSRLIMARIKSRYGDTLEPPEELDLAFLPDGLLKSETDIDRAKPFGIRPFTVDNILDRLNGISKGVMKPELLFQFLWQLLHRERISSFGTNKLTERAKLFNPKEWFWCRPGRARNGDERPRQQRERYLADVPVLCRDGIWRPAGKSGFGADWAIWLESGLAGNPENPTIIRRAKAYRALESVSPSQNSLIASPDSLIPYLNSLLSELPEEDNELEESLDELQINAERHAFLLRLGVWEVPPVEAFESRDKGNRDNNFPWKGEIANLQQKTVQNSGGWRFGLDGWSGKRHNNVYLGEDFRFAWELAEMAEKNPQDLAKALHFGSGLYNQLMNASVFCPSCNDSGSSHRSPFRHSSAADLYPSTLALQLQNECWVVCSRGGKIIENLQKPIDAWWHPKPLSGAGLRQSPFRLIPVCSPASGISDELRNLSKVNILEDASIVALQSLLEYLQIEYPLGFQLSSADRQALISLHRQIYERLAELAIDNIIEVMDVLSKTGVLCELGENLVYQKREEVFHDDGRYATYIRYFSGKIPLVILPRDREAVATRLRIQKLEVTFKRKGTDQGQDVTDELNYMLGDRIPELLAILVNHSLGTKTTDINSQPFEERARRLQALRVCQLKDLVIEASVSSLDTVTIGDGSDQDLFLENPTSKSPVLYHDFSGERWQDRLRRKIAPHLALVLENQAYSATFALFLLAETDAEREEFLLELGISSEDVSTINMKIGVSNEEDRKCHQRWYCSILESRSDDVTVSDINLEPVELVRKLADFGFDESLAQRIVEGGGGESVRSDVRAGSPLHLLDEAGVDIAILNDRLLKHNDTGLTITVAKQLLAQWLSQQGRRCAAVIAKYKPQEQDEAKTLIRNLRPNKALVFSLNPQPADVLKPVADLIMEFTSINFDVNLLVTAPEHTLAKLGGFNSIEALDAEVLKLYDKEEQKRILRQLAAQWREEIRILAVLSRTSRNDTRTVIRANDEVVCGLLPANPARPSEVRDALSTLLVNYQKLVEKITEMLNDSVMSPGPCQESLHKMAKSNGIDIENFAVVDRALKSPRRDYAKDIKQRSDRLEKLNISPRTPEGLQSLSPKVKVSLPGIKKVAAYKVNVDMQKRKQEYGDEGENWALAYIVGCLAKLDRSARDAAIDQILELLDRFQGKSVDAALSHSAVIRSLDIEGDDLINELIGLLHLSTYSDCFGFDMIGWLPPYEGATPQAMYIEVKSSGDEGFNFSKGEWDLAKKMHNSGEGTKYSVLVVRRCKHGGVPEKMDLLVDPVALKRSMKISFDVDGFKATYKS